MIRSFRDRRTAALFQGRFLRSVERRVVARTRRKLQVIHAAQTLEELGAIPGNRVEALRGDRRGQHSIRINHQWRICSRGDGEAHDVDSPTTTDGREHRHSDRGRRCRPGRLRRPRAAGRCAPAAASSRGGPQRGFLEPLGTSAYALAKALYVPVNRITAILAGERAVSADTALRLARFFGTTAEFWIGLQGGNDLARTRSERGAEIAAQVPKRAPAA